MINISLWIHDVHFIQVIRQRRCCLDEKVASVIKATTLKEHSSANVHIVVDNIYGQWTHGRMILAQHASDGLFDVSLRCAQYDGIQCGEIHSFRSHLIRTEDDTFRCCLVKSSLFQATTIEPSQLDCGAGVVHQACLQKPLFHFGLQYIQMLASLGQNEHSSVGMFVEQGERFTDNERVSTGTITQERNQPHSKRG